MFRKKDSTPSGMPAGAAPSRSAGSAGRSPAEVAPVILAMPARPASKGKQAYEARRAEKAGMGLEKWMAEKDRRVQAERAAVQRAHQKALPKKPGLLRRLLDKAHRPI